MKKISSILIILLLIIVTLLTLINPIITVDSISTSLTIWITNLLPSMLPFFILSLLLINYGFVELMGEIFKQPMRILFNVKKEGAFVLIMSMLSGFPSSSKYIYELYQAKKLNNVEAEQLLTFTHFSNPLFIIGTIGIMFLKSQKIGITILIVHYLTNFIVGILFRNYNKKKVLYEKTSIKNGLSRMHQNRLKSMKFSKALSTSISSSFNTLILIFGTLSFFLLITNQLISTLNLNQMNNILISGILEMTQGLKKISLIDIPLIYKASISTFFISFGGLSVHMQTIGVLSDTNIKYYPFLIARIIHGSISCLIIYFLFNIRLI